MNVHGRACQHCDDKKFHNILVRIKKDLLRFLKLVVVEAMFYTNEKLFNI